VNIGWKSESYIWGRHCLPSWSGMGSLWDYWTKLWTSEQEL